VGAFFGARVITTEKKITYKLNVLQEFFQFRAKWTVNFIISFSSLPILNSLFHPYRFYLFIFILVCWSFNLCGQREQDVTLKKILAGESILFRNPDSLEIYFSSQRIEGDSMDFYVGKFLQAQRLTFYSYPDSARELFDDVVRFATRKGNDELKVFAEVELSLVFRIIENFERSLQLMNHPIHEAEKSNSPQLKVRVFSKMAELQRAMGFIDEAYRYLGKAEAIAEKNKIEPGLLIFLYHRKAGVLAQNGKLKEAEAMSLKSLSYSIPAKNLHAMATSYNELGYIQRHYRNGSRNYYNALNYYSKAEAGWRQLKFYRYLVSAQFNSAHELRVNGKIKEAVQKCDSMILLSEKPQWNTILEDAHSMLSIIYRESNQWEKAYYHNEKRYMCHLELINSLSNRSIRELEVKYETEKKDYAIALEKENFRLEKQKVQAASQQRNFIFVISFLLFCMLCLVLFFSVRLRRKNKELNRQKEDISSINGQLRESLEQKNIFFAEMHHRVKNNLTVLAGLLELQAARSGSEQVKTELAESIQRIGILSKIHKNLYFESESAILPLDGTLSDIATNILRSFGLQANQVVLNIPAIGISVAEIVPLALIMNELITNSCKYGVKFPTDEVRINVSREGNQITVEVSDPGKGIKPETDLSNLKSLGLYLVSVFTKQLNGRMWFGQEDNRFVFKIIFNAFEIKTTTVAAS
jgi:two-component sensor histidine kinase